MWPADQVWTGRLTVRSPAPLEGTSRSRLLRRVESLNLRPKTMPPAAVLIVRHLRVAAEGPAGTGKGDWEYEARARLERLYRKAVRPGSPASASADAVIFADEAELYAYLAADALQGRIRSCWWWRFIGRRLGEPLNLTVVLAAAEQRLPAVFAALGRMGLAVRAAAALSRPAAAALLRTMLASHGAVELDEVFARTHRACAMIPPPARMEIRAPSVRPDEIHLTPAGLPEPPREALALPPENRVLITLALALAEAPRLVRAPSFATAAEAWFAAVLGADSSERLPARNAAQTAADPPSGTAAAAPERSARPMEPDEEPRAGRKGAVHEATPSAAGDPPCEAAALLRSNAPRPAPSVPENAPARTPARKETRRSTEPELDAGLQTNLGGALYLIPAFERLTLPACVEPEWPFSEHATRWGLLELVCRGLLAAGELAERHERDALWAVLAQLDGREPGQPPFEAFPRRGAFRLPGEWAAGLSSPGDQLCWAVRRKRIAIWTSSGWLLADRRLGQGESVLDALRLEAAPLRLAAIEAGKRPWAEAPHARISGRAASPALDFWLECALPAVRAWLARAMGLCEPSYAEIAAALLEVRGWLFVSPDRVDFAAPLDAVRIAVRRAGLDIDPGWLPAWGRSVRFHYRSFGDHG